MSYECIQVAQGDGITTITFNRPQVLNALSTLMNKELTKAFDIFAADDSQRVCILTGTGRAFCAGSDVKEASQRKDIVPEGASYFYGGLVERYDLFKPVIAAVNGIAVGGGFEVALCADIIVASETATFGLPEPLIGSMAAGGGVQRLSRQIGLKPAMGMILTGRHIKADEALRVGIVNEVVPAADLMNAAQRWARDILKCAPISVQTSKEAVIRNLETPNLEQAMETFKESKAYRRWTQSEDLREGLLAFAQKRPPKWSGR